MDFLHSPSLYRALSWGELLAVIGFFAVFGVVALGAKSPSFRVRAWARGALFFPIGLAMFWIAASGERDARSAGLVGLGVVFLFIGARDLRAAISGDLSDAEIESLKGRGRWPLGARRDDSSDGSGA